MISLEEIGKAAGLCTICGAECFEVIARYPEGHTLEGFPLKIGKPINEARRVTFCLSDGTTTDLTFCRDCQIEGRLAHIWDICLRALGWEIKNRNIFGVQDPTEAQKKIADEVFARLSRTTIIGIVTKQSWNDYARRS